ncbi:MAG TPA: sugar phosphate isomerase/epimerase family protein [Edaphobacter sp.]|uniref:sugar phosphate isomerase/epimerase family protein n=1 Tax=Edaphobacter sp. TaxID=1934404 RepID=UPI002CF776A2|nr:sugar phosphate isomerase/epimerase family protein [Edaphobacter sp.]HUZ94553.1 sugar phosphate isomerase/epimerase family protein [Edaphobacter sp.]
MQRGISTHVFLQQRLHSGLLDAMQKGGAQAIEVFAVRHHFDYADRSVVRELAAWFRSNDVAVTLHQPLYADAEWSRHVAPTLNLIDPEKSRRIDAMDEVKRAIESAEQIPFRAITLHLGLKDEPWNNRALENSLTAIEHLKAFAHPLGVKILLENLQNEVTTPEHLLEILRVGHFDNVGITLDVGHAHLSDGGIDAAFELLKPRIAELHLHDNQGIKDDHLWPGSAATNAGAPRPASGTWARGIDWKNVVKQIATLPPTTPGILEIAHDLEETAESVTAKAANSWKLFE